jgi:hypothetical protein
LERRGRAWLAGKWPSQEDEGWSGGSAIDSGLELWLAGVNMESMEYGERGTQDRTAVEGTVQVKPNSGLDGSERK